MSALSGETYRTRTVPGVPFAGAGRGSTVRRSRHHRNAARVLPLPVGAWMSVWRPAAMLGQPSACAGVAAAKVERNHSATAGENGASGPAVGAWVGSFEALTRRSV